MWRRVRFNFRWHLWNRKLWIKGQLSTMHFSSRNKNMFRTFWKLNTFKFLMGSLIENRIENCLNWFIDWQEDLWAVILNNVRNIEKECKLKLDYFVSYKVYVSLYNAVIPHKCLRSFLILYYKVYAVLYKI